MMPNLGESGQEIVGRLKRDLLPTLKNGVLYWPICDFVTFKFIPVHLQVCLGHFSLSSLYMVGLTRVLRKNYISIFAALFVFNKHLKFCTPTKKKKKKKNPLLLDLAQSYLANIFS